MGITNLPRVMRKLLTIRFDERIVGGRVGEQKSYWIPGAVSTVQADWLRSMKKYFASRNCACAARFRTGPRSARLAFDSADGACEGLDVHRRVIVVSSLLLTMAGGVTVAALPAPWIGTWQLDPAASTRAQPSAYKRVTLTITSSAEDALTVVYDMVGLRGGVTHLEWEGRFDGVHYPVQGSDTVMTNAYRRLDDRSYAIDVKVDGSPVATARASVSADGRTLTVTQQERDATGRQATSTAIYRRR